MKRDYTLRVFEVKKRDQENLAVMLQAIQAILNHHKIICTYGSKRTGEKS